MEEVLDQVATFDLLAERVSVQQVEGRDTLRQVLPLKSQHCGSEGNSNLYWLVKVVIRNLCISSYIPCTSAGRSWEEPPGFLLSFLLSEARRESVGNPAWGAGKEECTAWFNLSLFITYNSVYSK